MKTFRPLEERPVITTNTSLDANACVKPARSARKAALLSLLPGLGQFYNGEIGKAVLFLSIFLVNLVLLLCFLLGEQILGCLGRLAAVYHLQLNSEFVKWLRAVPGNGPFFLIYAGLIAGFVAYAMREAHDQALRAARGSRFRLGLREATSGSYLFHFSLMACGLVLMLFTVQPSPPGEQITDIELAPPPAPAKPVPKPPALPRLKQEETPKKVLAPRQEIKPAETQPLAQTPAPSPIAAAPPVPLSSPQPSSDAASGSSQGGSGSGNQENAGGGAEVDFGPYLAEIQKRIKKSWFPPRGNESKRITVKFKVHRDGEVTGVKLEKSSGFSIADDAALEAIEKAAPFPPLPPGTDESVVIKFTFDYNVFNGASG